MFSEMFIALFKAGLPVGVTAYLLVWWALRNGYLGAAGTFGEIEQEIKRLSKDKEKKKQGDPVHRKWLSLGGGFYGVVALVTLAWIELGEITDFLAGFEGLGTLTALLSFDTLVNVFIETLVNTVTALAWPAYWLGSVDGHYAWIWVVVAYAAYRGGSGLAVRHHGPAAGD